MIILVAGIVGVLVLAYLMGSFPTGYLVTRQLKGIDIREHGSGSTGATNVLRTVGKGPGLLVFATDISKGVAAVLLARWGIPFIATTLAINAPQSQVVNEFPVITVLAGAFAILGHSRPVWLNFKGGKSVATGLGVMFALHWPTGLIAFGAFGIMLALFRIVSLGSIVGAIATPVTMVVMGQPLAYGLFSVVAAGYVVNRHRSNIQRLLAGTEPRIGQSLESAK